MQYNITYRQKDKGWQYIISYKRNEIDKWKQKSKQGFKTRGIAKVEADKALEDLKKAPVIEVPKEYEGITFKSFGKLYLEHSKLYHEYKTVQSTETVLKKFSGLDDMPITEITNLNIQSIIDSFVKKGLKTNTIKYYLKKLTIIFNSAKKQYKIITDVPTKNIEIGKTNEIVKKALTESEVKGLLATFKKICNGKYYLLIYIAVNTGMRLGEILGLKWSDIDFKEHTINVNRQWKKNKDGIYDFGKLKSKNSLRVIPVSPTFCNKLAKYKKVINIDERIFNFTDNVNLLNSINSKFKSNDFNISFHELRHTYASKLIANGMDFKTAAQILGHDVEQTIKTYSHVNNDMMKKAKKLIENIF